ncbi:hypothetical protein BT67DRAFT_486380 [Trichocladium antarcticum]|uniref:rRNA methyltransferase 1, mitochondrial n=1 Tax=Trichocladium antarcticum TaxID=1450529 RepID=A0AAN6UEU6_9PEZI|nr:hypothetical protein BT67DRAFT_486380 [Trichocladium antarcticum]
MTLPLAYRAARHSVLATPASRVSLTSQSRHASLSAITRGLVRSEQARPQGGRPDKYNTPNGEKRPTYAERQKAREELAKARPDYKIRKGKKDITEYPEEAKPQSRRARFFDPTSSFGKQSIVYQAKTGRLLDEVKALQGGGGGGGGGSAFETTQPRPELRSRPRRTTGSASSGREGGGFADEAQDVVAQLSQGAGLGRGSGEGSGFSRDGGFGRDREPREGRGFGRDRAPREERGRGFGDGEYQDREPRKEREPLSIPYTSAASQFLYGKAVVEAALRSSRRKLYKLYIYGGANRQSAANDAHIQLLARNQRIPTTILGEDGLRLMDKMSSSRPHNGFVLEASPLPQPPLTALGPLADDYAANPGYAVVLAHQSAEDAAVNGTPAFIASPTATHKPLVVVLDQVLDPGNLGAILRTVSFLGATAVGITRRGSATLTPVALKASAGASETLTLFGIASLPDFLNGSRDNGWTTYAAVAAPPGDVKQRRHMDLHDVEALDPLRKEPGVLLIGNEGEGLDRLVVKKADYEVNIPNLSGSTAVDSLNVSVAAGLLCSAFLKGMTKEQQKTGELDGGLKLW